jgi:hypothetical protein
MTTATLFTFSPNEPIPGYLVRERLGAGGYGEVWKADAPGGLSKAVKIIFGSHDDERAARELAALNRIKQVRHPFLLSLERIERVDNHLVIVSELATSSLKQEFDKCREEGQPGIARGDLLAHLRDAADALDYISQQHCLQHLDVKPENLLLVGGRIKVADFGLVKDLQDVHSSIVGGMTPIYAPPELFDGRPSIHSDQYSLAIVYQEMLTGSLPFEGRTTAQLAAQHLHSRPRLDRLPLGDEPVIARALAKAPEERFGSCREMIECLLEAAGSEQKRAPRTVRQKAAPAPVQERTETEVISPETLMAARAAAAEARPAAVNKTQVTETPTPALDLPPLELDAADIVLRPTLFIGIGGVAVRALTALHARIEARFGDPAALGALQFLLFDTDAESLRIATEDGAAALGDAATVLLPLRPAADYRNDANGRFNWLSRRWIYNIPRNLQTQGLRPLGRLALVDNMERAVEKVAHALRTAADPAGVVATAAATGLPFQCPSPRVFIVSSTGGGTGSGMVLDFGYIVRQALRELKLPDDAVCALLAHVTGRTSQPRDIATANAYALLGELNHYSDPRNDYPGDPAAGLASFDAEDAPFNDAYVVHLGEELDADGFSAAIDKLATFLYYGSLSTAAAYFDRSRAGSACSEGYNRTSDDYPNADDTASAALRTFGLCPLGFSPEDVPREALGDLCRGMVVRWRGGAAGAEMAAAASLSNPTSLLAAQFARDASPELLQTVAAEQIAAAGIAIDAIVPRFHARLAEQMGNDRNSYLLKVLEELLHNFAPRRSFLAEIPPGKVIVEALDEIIRYQGAEDSHQLCLESALDAPIQEFADTTGGQLREWLLGLVNSPEYRLVGAQNMADHLGERLREISRLAGETLQAVVGKLRSLKELLLGDRQGGKRWLRYRGLFVRRLVADRRLAEYFELRLHELTLGAFCRLARLVIAQVTTAGDKLRNLSTDFNRLIEQFSAAPAESGPAGGRSEGMRKLAARQIAERRSELLAEMEQALEGELRRIAVTEVHEARRVLGTALRRAARTAVLGTLQACAAAATSAAVGAPAEQVGGGQEPLFELPLAVKEALPRRFAACGGKQRLLIVASEALSQGITPAALGDAATAAPTVIVDPQADMLICHEIEDLPLKRIASAVLDQRFQAVEAASRLHTRTDVPWTPL